MMSSTFHRITQLPLWLHSAAALASVGLFQLAKAKLDASYAASGHPVDYVTGQTSFNGATIKGYYAQMQELGTLDVYRTTQIIDFGFIAGMACVGLFVATLLARMARPASFGRHVGLFAGLALVLGACCDAIENGWSFVMLANPAGFADWIALPYSGFAVAKFGLIALGMLLILLCLLLTAIGHILKRPTIG
jgi:hypothetical protein